MKAIQLEKPRSFRRIEIAEPAAPGPGDALVRIHRIGICGTDYGGFFRKMAFFTFPRLSGHELCIEVVAAWGGGAQLKAGGPCSVGAHHNRSKSLPRPPGPTAMPQ